MIGHFDEEEFKRELTDFMGWRPGAKAADDAVEFMKAWFATKPLITLPCRDIVQAPDKGRTTIHCGCGLTWEIEHREGIGWEATRRP